MNIDEKLYNPECILDREYIYIYIQNNIKKENHVMILIQDYTADE